MNVPKNVNRRELALAMGYCSGSRKTIYYGKMKKVLDAIPADRVGVIGCTIPAPQLRKLMVELQIQPEDFEP